MKFTLAVLALATATQALTEEAQTLLVSNAFEEFKMVHDRQYTGDEHAKRMSIFSENLEKIAAKNAALRELGHDEIHGITR
jgi:hypothetical protein